MKFCGEVWNTVDKISMKNYFNPSKLKNWPRLIYAVSAKSSPRKNRNKFKRDPKN